MPVFPVIFAVFFPNLFVSQFCNFVPALSLYFSLLLSLFLYLLSSFNLVLIVFIMAITMDDLFVPVFINQKALLFLIPVNLNQYRVSIGVFSNFALVTAEIFTHYADACKKRLNSSLIVIMTLLLLIVFFLFFQFVDARYVIDTIFGYKHRST